MKNEAGYLEVIDLLYIFAPEMCSFQKTLFGEKCSL